MKSLGLWLSFIVALMASCRANAEYVDNLPPIPYQISALIRGAMANLPGDKFIKAIESDPNKLVVAILKRSGKAGQELIDADNKWRCDDETTPMDDERKARCFDSAVYAGFCGKVIINRDYARAVFKLAGYSFDKSFIAFANDCNTFGSCDIVADKILELTNNPESLEMLKLFVSTCSNSNPDIRKRFLPSNVAAACVKMMGLEPFKSKVCENKRDAPKQIQVICGSPLSETAKKSNICANAGDFFNNYPEIDCN